MDLNTMIKLIDDPEKKACLSEHKDYFALACMCTGKFSYLHELDGQDITRGFKTLIETIVFYFQTLKNHCENLMQSINAFPDRFATATAEWIKEVTTSLKAQGNASRIYKLQSLLHEYRNCLNTYTIKNINQEMEYYTRKKDLLYENITILFALHPLLSSQNLCRIIKIILNSTETKTQTERIFERITKDNNCLTISVPEEVIEQLTANQTISLLRFAIDSTMYTEYPLFAINIHGLKQKLIAHMLANPDRVKRIQQNINEYKTLSEYNSVKRYYQAFTNIKQYFQDDSRKLILAILNSDIPDKDKPLALHLFVTYKYNELTYRGNQLETLKFFQERNITESWIDTVERKILNTPTNCSCLTEESSRQKR